MGSATDEGGDLRILAPVGVIGDGFSPCELVFGLDGTFAAAASVYLPPNTTTSSSASGRASFAFINALIREVCFGLVLVSFTDRRVGV